MSVRAVLVAVQLFGLGHGADPSVENPKWKNWNKDLTILVPAGGQDCYFLPNISTGYYINIDFQVLNTGSRAMGNLDITATLLEPQGKVIQSWVRRGEGMFNKAALMDGDYKLCFDNVFSMLADKTVYLAAGMSFHEKYDDEYDDDLDDLDMESEEVRAMRQRDIDNPTDMAIEEIVKHLNMIRHRMGMANRHQGQIILAHTKDYHVGMNNNFSVSFWSMVHVTVLLLTGFIQVIMAVIQDSPRSVSTTPSAWLPLRPITPTSISF